MLLPPFGVSITRESLLTASNEEERFRKSVSIQHPRGLGASEAGGLGSIQATKRDDTGRRKDRRSPPARLRHHYREVL